MKKICKITAISLAFLLVIIVLGQATTQAQNPTPSLTASNVGPTTAALILRQYTGEYWIKRTAPDETACLSRSVVYITPVADLTPSTEYTYATYSDSSCTTLIASETFTTEPPIAGYHELTLVAIDNNATQCQPRSNCQISYFTDGGSTTYVEDREANNRHTSGDVVFELSNIDPIYGQVTRIRVDVVSSGETHYEIVDRFDQPITGLRASTAPGDARAESQLFVGGTVEINAETFNRYKLRIRAGTPGTVHTSNTEHPGRIEEVSIEVELNIAPVNPELKIVSRIPGDDSYDVVLELEFWYQDYWRMTIVDGTPVPLCLPRENQHNHRFRVADLEYGSIYTFVVYGDEQCTETIDSIQVTDIVPRLLSREIYDQGFTLFVENWDQPWYAVHPIDNSCLRAFDGDSPIHIGPYTGGPLLPETDYTMIAYSTAGCANPIAPSITVTTTATGAQPLPSMIFSGGNTIIMHEDGGLSILGHYRIEPPQQWMQNISAVRVRALSGAGDTLASTALVPWFHCNYKDNACDYIFSINPNGFGHGLFYFYIPPHVIETVRSNGQKWWDPNRQANNGWLDERTQGEETDSPFPLFLQFYFSHPPYRGIPEYRDTAKSSNILFAHNDGGEQLRSATIQYLRDIQILNSTTLAVTFVNEDNTLTQGAIDYLAALELDVPHGQGLVRDGDELQMAPIHHEGINIEGLDNLPDSANELTGIAPDQVTLFIVFLPAILATITIFYMFREHARRLIVIPPTYSISALFIGMQTGDVHPYFFFAVSLILTCIAAFILWRKLV